MTLHLTGIHHVSAITAHIGRSHDFYTEALGLRPVIKSVNQDDPTMYHLFFGDGAGTPGSDITLFDIPYAAPERRGAHSITRTTFRVNGDRALTYWMARLEELGVPHEGIHSRGGRLALDFQDYEGTLLSLVDDGGSGDAFPWDASPVPPEFQVRGLGFTVITVPELEPTEHFLTAALGLVRDRSYSIAEPSPHDAHVFSIGEGGAHAEVHVVVNEDLPAARSGAGGVHHVALRVPEPDARSMPEWVERLTSFGYPNSGIVDRHYFTSIYVREPNHVLFELATDGPGFDVDGPLDGDRLSLPPFLEPRRAEIESALKPIA